MEIILVLIAILIISRRKGTFSSIPIQDLPVGVNEDKKFDEGAFTVYFYKLKGEGDKDIEEGSAPNVEEAEQVG